MTDETRNFTDADLARIVELQAQQKATATPAAPGAPEPVEPKPNAFAVGTLVTHTWEDEYPGPHSRDAIVVEQVPDAGDGAGPKVVIAPLGERSGSIAETEITAV